MPAVKGEGMRGLSVFISDIRGCELESDFDFDCPALGPYGLNLIPKAEGRILAL